MPTIAAVRRVVAGVSCILFGSIASAQDAAQRAPLVVRVHVADSSGAPVVGADVSVMRGLTQVLAHGVTDERGDQSLSVARGGDDDELVVRKIGFARQSRFFSDTNSSLSFTITLARAAQSLDTVKVAAKENDVRRKSYFIDADEIEHSPRIVVDALDIVMKLKPDMIWGRAGQPDRIGQHGSTSGRMSPRSAARVVRQALKYGYCAPVENIWVNGARIRSIAYDPVAVLKRVGEGLFINQNVATVLGSIKPEHIAEIQYHPCTDMEGDSPVRSNNAIMVTLKDGIGFEPGAGSYIAKRYASAAPTAATPAPASTIVSAPAVRANRILGVFDQTSGDPLVGAEVVDIATGTIAKTTVTGTVSLLFLPAGQSYVRIQRAGYDPQTMLVSMSPRDTVPVTVVLVKK